MSLQDGTAAAAEGLQDGELLAAIDLGSNSFHMVVARYVLGQLRIVDKIREMVRMGAGLDANGSLNPLVLQRALDCLQRFGQRVASIPPHRVRAIATNTVRRMRMPQVFLLPAETALGRAIEMVSGREEARLIYLGAAFGQPPDEHQRLVIDIGGGSTEFIIGRGFEPLERESLQMGCIATTRRFFDDGQLTARRWNDALTEVKAEFQQFDAAYRTLGWQRCLGSSGTIKSIGQIVRAGKNGGGITLAGLRAISKSMIAAGSLSRIHLKGLNEERLPTLPGGLLVLEAAFEALGIEQMEISATAMREGILYDMIGRAEDRDPRASSIAALAARYGVDAEQAARVEATARRMFEQVATAWDLGDEDRRMLVWAARIHEVGLAIAHSQYHVHSAYVIEHSDIAGFSTQEQQALSALLRCHRRSPPVHKLETLPERLARPMRRLMVLLRLAVLLHRGHAPDGPPAIELQADSDRLQLRLPATWLATHPLTRADLEAECEFLAEIDWRLDIVAVDAGLVAAGR